MVCNQLYERAIPSLRRRERKQEEKKSRHRPVSPKASLLLRHTDRKEREKATKERKERKGGKKSALAEGPALHLADPGGPQKPSTAPVHLSFDSRSRTVVLLGLAAASLT